MNLYIKRLCAAIVSLALLRTAVNGAALPEQWNLSDAPYGIAVQTAWDKGFTGEGIRLALIDSGVNAAHEDLRNINIEQGWNVIDNNDDTSDNLGHGTVVAGIIAADRNNGVGISGICDGVTIVPIKAFDSSLTNVKHITAAIYKAVDEFDCDVINLSLGVSTDTPALREAVEYAASKNVIIVSAVGNSGESDAAQLLYPAAYDVVVGVGAHGQDGQVSSFSHINSSVLVTAPGEQLYSLDAKDTDGYRTVNGTSFAAAQVSALAVLAKTYDREMNVAEFQRQLESSAVDAGPAGYDTAYGYGMVNVPRLLAALEALPEYRDTAEHWARENIQFCTERGLMSGTAPRQFSPDLPLSRAMIVTILWRLEGSPDGHQSLAFHDIHTGDWFFDAVAWAAETSIVSGYLDGTFGPDDSVTREQLAAVIYRYAKYRGTAEQPVSLPSGYTDWNDVSPYAADAVSWAIENGIMRGKTAETFVPKGQATRAEAATILRNFLTKITL